MSTEIKDSTTGDGPHRLSVTNKRWVSFYAVTEHADAWAEMSTPDFITAVENELNGIFISRDDLPEVVKEESGWNFYVDGHLYSSSFQAHRELALRHLAAAEYLKKNPPLDQKQVDTLAVILGGRVSPWDAQHVAREILASGKVTVND